MILMISLACTDYSYFGEEDVNGGSNTTPPGTTDSGGDRPPSFDDPPNERPPTFLDGDCEGNETAWFDFSEIYVKSWDVTLHEGAVHADVAGWYHIYDRGMAESGSSQTNETAFVRILNVTNPSGLPAWANCGDDWFVVDADNFGAPNQPLYVGTFWLDEGDNALELMHYCPVYRNGGCTGLHITDWGEGTCESTNPNSVHLSAEGACVVPAD